MKNFDNFGVMIDCSRNAVPNISGLKKFFKIISEMGYDLAMLYTEDTYEVDGEPFFGYKRGRYSKSEIKELDAYAKSVGVELIPCIQTLAHLRTILRWDVYRPIYDIDDIILADEDRTYEFIENMFKTMSETFTTRKVHIGMDEAHNVGLGRYLDKHGFTNRYELLMRHLKKVCEIAKKYGFEPLMWSDMFFRLVNGGAYRPVDEFPHEILDNMPKEISLVYWDYYSEDYDKYVDMIKSHKKLTDKVWFAGGAWCWGNFAPHSRLSIRRNAKAIPACIDNGIKNVVLTMWGDNGGECPYFSVLPALMHAAALAEGMSEDEMKAKFRAVTGDEYDAFIDLDLPNHVYGESEMVGSAAYCKQRLYNDVFLGILDLSAPGADASLYEKYAEKLRADAKASRDFKYLFESAAALCDVLKTKFYLGARIREAYLKGDKAALKNIADGDFTDCIGKIRLFHKAFRTQWYAVNKTYGFEVQDTRLGGLILRMESCLERLNDYIDGKIENIAELEEEVLSNDMGGMNEWARAFTANVI